MLAKLGGRGMPVAVAMLALAVAFVGYAIKTSPSAAASSGASPVNIADGTNGTLAHVTKGGALQVNNGGTQNVVPAVQRANALNLFAASPNNFNGAVPVELIIPTTAAIDLTSLTVALDADNPDPWFIDLLIVRVPNFTPAGSCWTSQMSYSLVQYFQLHPGETSTVSFPSPLLIAPPVGQTLCVVVSAGNKVGTDSNNFHYAEVSATGYVASGTYSGSHGTDPIRSQRAFPGVQQP